MHPDPIHTGLHPFLNTGAFLFGDGAEDGDHCVAEGTTRIDIRFPKGSEGDAIFAGLVEVREGLKRPFSGQAVQGPKQQHFKTPLGRIRQHALELRAVRMATTFVIDVLADNFPILGRSEPPQLVELGVYLLTASAVLTRP
jgi:hypothetical protein